MSKRKITRADLEGLGDPNGAATLDCGGVEVYWNHPECGKISLRADPLRPAGYKYTLYQDGVIADGWDEREGK